MVGAGQSGYVAATTLRKLDPDRQITVFGDEAHPPYERPPLSKDVLLDGAAGLPAFLPGNEYAARDISLVTGVRVQRIDPAARAVILADDTAHRYDTLVLTTGSRPFTLAFEGAEHVRYLRSFDDALAIRAALDRGARLLCIGAGVIGLELAASARKRGAEVTVVEAGDTAMARSLPAPEARFLQSLHEQQGVRFRFGTTVTEIAPKDTADGGPLVAQLSDGGRIEADLVVAGVGVLRNDELARESGLAVDRGILVDEFGRTSDPAIYSAGDAAAFWHPTMGRRLRLESWHHALEHASSVARGMLDGTTAYAPVPRFWTDQHGLNIQVVGEHAKAASVVVEGSREDRRYSAIYLDADERIVCAVCVNDARRIRPLLKSIATQERASAEMAGNGRRLRAFDYSLV